MQGVDDQAVKALAQGELENAGLDSNEFALMQYVEKLTRHSYRCTAEDVDELRKHGWSDAQVAETVYVTAMFAFYNRVADAFGLEDPGYANMDVDHQKVFYPANDDRS